MIIESHIPVVNGYRIIEFKKLWANIRLKGILKMFMKTGVLVFDIPCQYKPRWIIPIDKIKLDEYDWEILNLR